jgi:hypothetical protein
MEVFRYIPEEQLLPFIPSSASEAKKKVMINYYLNSPDAETQGLERAAIALRSAENTAHLRDEMQWERGHKPSRHKIVVPTKYDYGHEHAHAGESGAGAGGRSHASQYATTGGGGDAHAFVGGLATPAGKSDGGGREPGVSSGSAANERVAAGKGTAGWEWEGSAEDGEEVEEATVAAEEANAAMARLSANAAVNGSEGAVEETLGEPEVVAQ